MRILGRLVAGAVMLAALASPAAARELSFGVLRVDGPAAVPAVPKAQQLDILFDDLQKADSVADGRAIEAAIVALWLESGDQQVDQFMRWAIAAMNIRSYALALNYLDTVVALKPDYAEGWNKRATVYYLLKDFDKSVADIDKTLALEPRHFGALAGLGMIRQAEGDLEGAADAYKRALAINPNLEQISNALYRVEQKLRGKRI